MINPNDKAEKFFGILKSSPKKIAYDVETNGLSWKKCHVVGYSVSNGKEAAYVPVRHETGGNVDNVCQFEADLATYFLNYSGVVIGHNIKFDAHFSKNHNIDLGRNIKDTMIQEALIDENQWSYSLENVCKNYPEVVAKKGKLLYQHISEMFGCKADRNSMGLYYKLNGCDPVAVEYAEGDTLSTFQLYEQQERKLAIDNLEYVANLENNLTNVLIDMERKGLKVDLEEAARVKLEIDKLHFEAYQNIPLKEDLTPININSGKDLREYYELCGIDDFPYTEPTARHPMGQPSFTKAFLSTNDQGLLIIRARALEKLKNTYIDKLDDFLYQGRVHTNFNQTLGEFGGTRTGRFSCFGPNMQQVPKRDKFLGAIYRRMFVPDDNYIYVEFDYSQCEPRLYSHYSQEPILIEGYNATPFIDMHDVAAKYMEIGRDPAKNLNLGMMYVMGIPKLAASLGVSHVEAEMMYRRWHKTFRRVSSFTREASKVMEDRGYVKTILGRRARIGNNNYSYRAANRLIQGGSADILKYKMYECYKWIKENSYQDVVHMLLTIHDAILFQIHKEYIHLIPEIKKILEDVNEGTIFNLRVPFVAEYLQGDNWAKASYKHLQ